jgi:hypothetical protein
MMQGASAARMGGICRIPAISHDILRKKVDGYRKKFYIMACMANARQK